jgi:hypothetical protein
VNAPAHRRTLARRFTLLAGALSIFAPVALGQVGASGSFRSSFFAWQSCVGSESPTECDANRLDFYQGVRLRIGPQSGVGPSFRTYARVARRGDPPEWDGRLYNAYLRLPLASGRVDVRAGRQFLYNGVINATADAVNIGVAVSDRIDLRVVGGVSAPEDRDFDVLTLKEGGVFGAYGSARLAPQAKLDLSYFQRTRSDELAWQLLGSALTGQLTGFLAYFVQFDYNLQTSDYQGMRYRLTYLSPRIQLSAEYQSQRPRVYEDSFFNRFELFAFNQIRGAATYRMGRYAVTVQDLYTLYQEGETGNQIMASLDAFWGSIGIVYQSGFGGDRFGLFGTARYEFLPGLAAKAHASYYDYQRFTASFDEDATAYSAGLDYRPSRSVILDAEVQQSLNSLYDDKLRGLFRFTYLFRTR